MSNFFAVFHLKVTTCNNKYPMKPNRSDSVEVCKRGCDLCLQGRWRRAHMEVLAACRRSVCT